MARDAPAGDQGRDIPFPGSPNEGGCRASCRPRDAAFGAEPVGTGSVAPLMGSLIKKRRKRMRKKKHKKMLKRTRWQRRAAGK
jgi:hypothetical protein